MAPCCTMMILRCLVLFLMASSSLTAAARTGATMEIKIKNRKSLGIKYSHIFGYLPKGVPIPPSAPSKRHNSFVDSLPH
ncbi:PREDICTED: protein IDA-like [Camelina sativa]|uniref:Protein IDA-like n=1 Tax=Camelina sativa TaxID=90675 RepID=A0ABM1R3S9_CAMSA|nr:PREDICTED: protein IDA-like [Camelina sativa]